MNLSPLNERQRLFAKNLALGMSGAEAAIKAGYSASTAPNMASLLRRDPRVREFLEAVGCADAA